jgi:hypothetical protein
MLTKKFVKKKNYEKLMKSQNSKHFLVNISSISFYSNCLIGKEFLNSKNPRIFNFDDCKNLSTSISHPLEWSLTQKIKPQVQDKL